MEERTKENIESNKRMKLLDKYISEAINKATEDTDYNLDYFEIDKVLIDILSRNNKNYLKEWVNE